MADKLDYTNIDQPYNSLMEKINGDMTAIKNGTGILGQSYFNVGTSVGNLSDSSQLSVDNELNQVTSPSQIRGGTVSNGSFNNIWLTNWMKSTNYQAKARGFYIDGTRGYIECANIYARGNITVGSLDIPDQTSANSFHVTSAGNSWWGANLAAGYAAAPAYILATGTARFTTVFIGAVGRTGDALANAINSSSQLVTDVVNARLNTSSQQILAGFDFGTTNFAGAVKAGDIAWNPSTGAYVSGSGVAIYKGGLVGANGSSVTFSINSSTGSAYFAGEVAAAYGTLGALTINVNGNIKSGQTAYDTGTGFWIGNDGGIPKFSIGNSGGNKITWNGTTLSVTGYIAINGALADIQGNTTYLSDIKAGMGTITSGSFRVASSIQIKQGGGTVVGYLGQDPGATGIWGFIAERGYGLMCRYTGNNYFRIYMDVSSTDAIIDMPSPDKIKIQDNEGRAITRFYGTGYSSFTPPVYPTAFYGGLVDLFAPLGLYVYNYDGGTTGGPEAGGYVSEGMMYVRNNYGGGSEDNLRVYVGGGWRSVQTT